MSATEETKIYTAEDIGKLPCKCGQALDRHDCPKDVAFAFERIASLEVALSGAIRITERYSLPAEDWVHVASAKRLLEKRINLIKPIVRAV